MRCVIPAISCFPGGHVAVEYYVQPAKNSHQETFEKRMSSSLRILSISDDDGLRNSRELVLSSGGYETESITSTAVLSVTWVRSFDIAVICRSVEPERAMALMDMLRRYHPGIQIISISPLERSFECSEPDMEIGSGPEMVLAAVRRCSSHTSFRKTLYEAHHA